MTDRPKYSRWRRLPMVFRFGEHKLPDPDLEPQRLTVYLSGRLLDAAERQAIKSGDETIQNYCERILTEAIDAERVRGQVADVEARRGTLEGLNLIANDPEYLAEWNAQSGAPPYEPVVSADDSGPPIDVEFRTVPDPASLAPSPPARAELAGPGRLSHAAEVMLKHAGQGAVDPHAFLATLRRGEPVLLAEVAELAKALHSLETESRGARGLDRRVAFALYRLAFESQVLHTDAWPGGFDDWTVDTIRAVQEAVERILSGQDIRYPTDDPPPEAPL